jgi:hypothetical protein
VKRLWVLPPLAIVALAVLWYRQWQHWLSYATGSYNVQGVAHNYNAFSGSLSDVGELTIVTSVLASSVILWRAHTCHRYWWCWRHGHFPLDGTTYKLCSHHHPDDVPTLSEALADHDARVPRETEEVSGA